MEKFKLPAYRSQTAVVRNLLLLRVFPPCIPFCGIGMRFRYILWVVLVSLSRRTVLRGGFSMFGSGHCTHDHALPEHSDALRRSRCRPKNSAAC